MSDISTLVTSLGLAASMARGLVDERDRQKAAAIQIDLTKQILDAQAQLSQVLASVIAKDAALHAANERIRELDAAQAEKARYRLAKLGTVGSFFAYELRTSAELVERADEPAHFLCQPCFDAGKKSVLRFGATASHCSLCKANVTIAPSTAKPRAVARSPGIGRDW